VKDVFDQDFRPALLHGQQFDEHTGQNTGTTVVPGIDSPIHFKLTKDVSSGTSITLFVFTGMYLE